MTVPNAKDLRTSIKEALASGSFVSISPYVAASNVEVNEFCLFLKPELATLDDHLGPVWELIVNRLTAFNQQVTSACVLPWKYMANHHLMEAHYGVINAISERGLDALSEEARRQLQKRFPAQMLQAKCHPTVPISF